MALAGRAAMERVASTASLPGASMPRRRSRVDTIDVSAPATVESAMVLCRLSPIAGRTVHAAFDGGRLTSDAGVLVLADIERRLDIAGRLARCLPDLRAPERVRHSIVEMLR